MLSTFVRKHNKIVDPLSVVHQVLVHLAFDVVRARLMRVAVAENDTCSV